MDLQGRVKFPTGGGQVLEHNQQTDNVGFCRKSKLEIEEILLYFEISN